MNEQKFKPAWRSYYRHITLILLCLAAAVALAVSIPEHLWLASVAVLAALCAACNMMYKRGSVVFIVREDEIALECGLIGRKSIEISTRNIRTIQINQSLIQRILNVGDIRVASSGTDEYEIVVSNMPKPNDIRETMQIRERAFVKKEENREKAENKA